MKQLSMEKLGHVEVTTVSKEPGQVWRNRLIQFVMLGLCTLLFASSLSAQQANPSEYEVKAAYLLNFAKFTQWPTKPVTDENGGTFAICVMGKDPFRQILDTTISGETQNGKNVVARRISRSGEALACNIVFISSSEEARAGQILKRLHKTPVLTVSDMPHFSKRGGMIEFTQMENQIRFQVNLTPAKHAGLDFSSQLLKVATKVTGSPRSQN